MILISLLLYFIGDRLTPYTTQARIQAFVVPVAAEVAGKFSKVYIRNNDEVQPGQPLFDIDPKPYQIALQRARADYASVRSSVKRVRRRGRGARSLAAAQAHREMAESDATRQEHLYKEDPGAISVRRLRARRRPARKRGPRSAAPRPICASAGAAGEPGDDNTQVQSARAAVEKAELDLARTKVLAPARGVVTDLRTDVGHYAQPGAPVMTADRDARPVDQRRPDRKQPRQYRAGGQSRHRPDILPGEVLKGRVQHRRRRRPAASHHRRAPRLRCKTVATGCARTHTGRDRVRPAELATCVARIGGQAEVLVYTDDNPIMNTLGALYIRFMSWLSYLY